MRKTKAVKAQAKNYLLRIGAGVLGGGLVAVFLYFLCAARVEEWILQTRCRELVRHINFAITLYVSDNGVYPIKLNTLFPLEGAPRGDYTKQPVCPKSKKSYVYEGGPDVEENLPTAKGEVVHAPTLVLWCPEPCHQGRRVFLFSDGSNHVFYDAEINWEEKRLRCNP